MRLPEPVIEPYRGFLVVRDDLLPGGTKRRAIDVFFKPEVEEYVYCSPVYGFAQLALAHAARDAGKRATIFCAKRLKRHLLTDQAERAGAKICEVPHGYMSVLRARAREYSERTGAEILPFGLNDERFVLALADVARCLPLESPPLEVWTACGSGTLSRALQLAWPEAAFYGVQVGARPDAGCAHLFVAPEQYEAPAWSPPPFPSNPNYDAKVWQFMQQFARQGALFWNVGA